MAHFEWNMHLFQYTWEFPTFDHLCKLWYVVYIWSIWNQISCSQGEKNGGIFERMHTFFAICHYFQLIICILVENNDKNRKQMPKIVFFGKTFHHFFYPENMKFHSNWPNIPYSDKLNRPKNTIFLHRQIKSAPKVYTLHTITKH